MLLKLGDRSVFHTNDARISLSQARRAMTEVGGSLDVMGVQMSGASWHPVRYEYGEVERISTTRRIGDVVGRGVGSGLKGSAMSKQIISTDKAPSSPLYSQGVRVGSTIYVSGMVGIDPVTGQLVGASIQEQTRQSLRNCEAVVEAGGGKLADVVQVTVLLSDPADFAGMNEAYAEVFATDLPTRAVAKLGVELPNVLISVLMTAQIAG